LFLEDGKLLDNRKDTTKIQRKAVRYTIIGDTLYRRLHLIAAPMLVGGRGRVYFEGSA
jgi:hypothetical protein